MTTRVAINNTIVVKRGKHIRGVSRNVASQLLYAGTEGT